MKDTNLKSSSSRLRCPKKSSSRVAIVVVLAIFSSAWLYSIYPTFVTSLEHYTKMVGVETATGPNSDFLPANVPNSPKILEPERSKDAQPDYIITRQITNHTRNASNNSNHSHKNGTLPRLETKRNVSDVIGMTSQNIRPSNDKTLVLLMAYMRGGSSFLGQMFVTNPDAFFWFEIVDPMYGAMMGLRIYNNAYEITHFQNGTRRTVTEGEISIIKRLLELYMKCDFEKMPVEMFTSQTVSWSGPKWLKFKNCFKQETATSVFPTMYRYCLDHLPEVCSHNVGLSMEAYCHWYKHEAEKDAGYKSVWENVEAPKTINNETHQGMKLAFEEYVKCIHSEKITKALERCLPLAKNECVASSIVSAKLLRVNIWDLEKILSNHGDWKIVHQIRDPRGVLISQRTAGIMTKYSRRSIISESSILCDKMLNDTKSLQLYNASHPGQYLQVKYENYADAPVATVRRIYSHLGVEVNPKVIESILELTSAKQDADLMDQHRKNSSETARKWTAKLTSLEKRFIDNHCRSLYESTGYPEKLKLRTGDFVSSYRKTISVNNQQKTMVQKPGLKSVGEASNPKIKALFKQ